MRDVVVGLFDDDVSVLLNVFVLWKQRLDLKEIAEFRENANRVLCKAFTNPNAVGTMVDKATMIKGEIDFMELSSLGF